MQVESCNIEAFAARADGANGREAVAPPALAGAPPSITAPANCIRPLRFGVDSLYLSYPGMLDRQVEAMLQESKDAAKSFEEAIQSRARYSNGAHDFTVLGRGRGRFSFVLEDGWFRIELSNTKAKALPLAHVQVRSEYLTAVGMEEAIATLDDLLPEFGDVQGPAGISRIDLFVDFTTDLAMTAFPGAHWIKRCRKRDIHEDRDYVTGISFGAGNEVSARLYDKTVEILKSKKDYLKPLWQAQGWEEGQTVWRMEFQVRREGLPESLKIPASETVPLLGDLWAYLTTEWLRLAIPSDTDETRSRWPTHPAWQELAATWQGSPEGVSMLRADKRRAPCDDAIFKSGLWGLSSFMGREGIHRLDEGLGEFLHALQNFFDSPQSAQNRTLAKYLEDKARSKARRYNVRMQDDERS